VIPDLNPGPFIGTPSTTGDKLITDTRAIARAVGTTIERRAGFIGQLEGAFARQFKSLAAQ